MPSPFTPYLGTAPKVLVGRDNEITSYKTTLNESAKGKPVVNIR